MSRSLKKGPYVAYHIVKQLRKKVSRDVPESSKVTRVKTWSRGSVIITEMVGMVFSVHDGRKHVDVFVSEHMVGHKLGEFVPTRVFKGHTQKK